MCEALSNTGLAGRPSGYFALGPERALLDHWQLTEDDYQTYLAKVMALGTTPNGVFGAKIMCFTFPTILAKFQGIPGCTGKSVPELLSMLFPNLHYIFITRRDKLRQAISYVRALETGVWRQGKRVPTPDYRTLPFNPAAIDARLQQIQQEEIWMHEFFERYDIEPFKVVYEDFVEAYEETAKGILRYLEIPFPRQLEFGEREMIRQADAVTEEWVLRYQKLKQTAL